MGERLFVAVEIPPGPRAEIDAAVGPIRDRYPELQWTGTGDWHLTLVFLGDTAVDRVQSAVDAVGRAASQVGPFGLEFDGTVGRFGNRVLWAGLRPAPALNALAAATDEALRMAGFELERRAFAPHLTLARRRRGARVEAGTAANFDGPTPRWTVSRVVLMRSSPRGDGRRYQPRAVLPLRSGDAGGGETDGRATRA